MRSFVFVSLLFAVACGTGRGPSVFREPASTIAMMEMPLDGLFDLGDRNAEYWHPDRCGWASGATTTATAASGPLLLIDGQDCAVSSSPVPMSAATALHGLTGQAMAMEPGCSDIYCAALLIRQYSASREFVASEMCPIGATTVGIWQSFRCEVPRADMVDGFYVVTVIGPPAPVVPVAVRVLDDGQPGASDQATGKVTPSR